MASAKRSPKRRNVPDSERKEARIPILLAPPVAERYRALAKKKKVAVSEPARRGLAFWESLGGRLPRLIRVWGTISAGVGAQVRPLEDCFVNVGDELSRELQGSEYFLIVDGDSMSSLDRDSIKHGTYALFRPDRDPCGQIVHVEWEDDSGERVATLKRFICGEGDSVTLRPSNPDHAPIEKKLSEVHVRGVFVKSWSPRSGGRTSTRSGGRS